MTKNIKLRPPSMPNFVSYEVPVGLKQQGFTSGNLLSVADFTPEEAIEYGELMKQEFIKHCEIKRSIKANNR